MKLCMWGDLYESFKGMASEDYTKARLQHAYEQESLIWKIFYGKTNENTIGIRRTEVIET